VVEAAPRLDRRADDDELGAALGRHPSDLLAEASRPRADDLPPDGDTVRARHRGCRLEPFPEARELSVEMRIDRQLALEDGGRDEDDPGSTVGGEPAGEVERVLGLLPVEQRHDDRAIRDRAGPAREAPGAAVEEVDVRQLHFRSWYGTEARITFGSKSRRRLR
jgi:hypothetical protein